MVCIALLALAKKFVGEFANLHSLPEHETMIKITIKIVSKAISEFKTVLAKVCEDKALTSLTIFSDEMKNLYVHWSREIDRSWAV